MNGGQASVLEGQHGGSVGMTCREFLGGTGTSSRVVNGGGAGEGIMEGKIRWVCCVRVIMGTGGIC